MELTESNLTWKDFFILIKSVIPSKLLLVVAISMEVLSSVANLMIPLVTSNIVDDFSIEFL